MCTASVYVEHIGAAEKQGWNFSTYRKGWLAGLKTSMKVLSCTSAQLDTPTLTLNLEHKMCDTSDEY